MAQKKKPDQKIENKTQFQLDRIEILDSLLVDSMVDFNQFYFDKISMEDF